MAIFSRVSQSQEQTEMLELQKAIGSQANDFSTVSKGLATAAMGELREGLCYLKLAFFFA